MTSGSSAGKIWWPSDALAWGWTVCLAQAICLLGAQLSWEQHLDGALHLAWSSPSMVASGQPPNLQGDPGLQRPESQLARWKLSLLCHILWFKQAARQPTFHLTSWVGGRHIGAGALVASLLSRPAGSDSSRLSSQLGSSWDFWLLPDPGPSGGPNPDGIFGCALGEAADKRSISSASG